MNFMKKIVDYTGNKVPLIWNTMMLSSDTMVDKDEFDIINNDIGYSDNIFQPGTFRGSSEVDVSLF